MEKGTIKFANHNRYYGFIIKENGEEIFFHGSDVKNVSYDLLEPQMTVEFDIKETPKGLTAINITLVD